MKTIKIIDLLNLVYEKKAPKKILYKYCEYEFNPYEEDYINKEGLYLFIYLFDNEDQVLYIEVGVIEDKPKKIEKLSLWANCEVRCAKKFDSYFVSRMLTSCRENQNEIIDKLSEVINTVNCLLEKSDKDE